MKYRNIGIGIGIGTAIALVAAIGTFGAHRAAAREPGSERARGPRFSPAEQLKQRDAEIAGWMKALNADSTSAIALGQLAGLFLQRGRESGNYEDFLRAETHARRSLASTVRRNGKSYVTLVSSLLAQHRFPEAYAAAKQLTALEPDLPQYRAILGETQLELGDYAGAAASFESLHRFRTHLSIAPRLARWAELRGRTAYAREVLSAARNEAVARGDLPSEQLAWFYLRLGEFNMRTGRPRAARRDFQDGLALVADDFRLLGALARHELSEGDPAHAIELGERSIAQRLDPLTLGTLSDSYAALGDSARAGAYVRAMEIAVIGQPGPYHRAWALFLLDRGLRVEEVLTQAQQELSVRRDIHGYDILAWALYKSRRYEEAWRASRMAMRLSAEDASIYYHAGMIKQALGDRSAARDYLERALTINPSFHPTQAAVARTALDSLFR